MAWLGYRAIDDTLTFYVNTTRFDTGVATDADTAPTYRVYEDETTTAIATGSMALLDSSNTAGFYSEQITLSAANGYEAGKDYSIYIGATVNGVAGATNHQFCIGPQAVNVTQWLGGAVATPTQTGVPEVDVTHWQGTVLATPTIGGVPEVDLTHILGVAQSAADLKDFADSGYDPSTNQVEGVKLADALTTNNDKSGYSLTADFRIKKNTALANFVFLMVDSTDHTTPKTGLTVTAERSLDGAALAGCANAVSEISNGLYKISLDAADLNGDVVCLRFSSTGADDRLITIVTQTE